MEVLLAVVLLAGGVLFVFQSYHTSLRALHTSRETLCAALLLEERIGELEHTPRRDFPPTLSHPMLGTISWDDETTETDDPSLRKHQLTVSWGSSNHPQSLEENAYVWE